MNFLILGVKIRKSGEPRGRSLFHRAKKAIELKTQIDQTDKEIDQMVYELYGLTEEEIKIVEESYVMFISYPLQGV